MLKRLKIKDIVLIDSLEIEFHEGLNILSGETGSGKSALIEGLKLISGDKGGAELIRKGAEKGVVEAEFDISLLPELVKLLKEAGIEHNENEHLFLKKEISLKGKNRNFINNQAVQLFLLKQVSLMLLRISSQHANQYFLSLDNHRKILDLFADCVEDAACFSFDFKEEAKLLKSIEEYTTKEQKRQRDLSLFSMELSEIKNGNLQIDEEEILFKEYALLSRSEEIQEKLKNILEALENDSFGSLSLLKKQKHAFNDLAGLDNDLNTAASIFNAAFLELQEVSFLLNNYLSRLECQPERFGYVHSRLKDIHKLKQKYGKTIQEIFSYQAQIEEKVILLTKEENSLDKLQKELCAMQEKNEQACRKLTAQRTEAAKRLENEMTAQIQLLNMPKAQFKVMLMPQERSQYGDEQVEFFILPNIGEKMVPLRSCASGGELSRILLAFHTVLAGKEGHRVLIFDEIDANIGGETARIIGETLQVLTQKKYQIICITHFPQVAVFAAFHFQVFKHEDEGRTFTRVRLLSNDSKEKELARMLGNHKFANLN